jgi:outer membrane protein
VRIARLDQKMSRLLFEQQLLETIYGVSRLYFDLVSLGENIGVKEESLAAAQRLYDDDKNQVDEGTLAPVELTRAQALLSSSRLDLIQAQGEYRQREVILREQLLRRLGDPIINFASIIPTDRILVPDKPPELDVPGLTQDALANRPDLAQAALQVQTDEISSKASRNNVRPPAEYLCERPNARFFTHLIRAAWFAWNWCGDGAAGSLAGRSSTIDDLPGRDTAQHAAS